MTSIDNMTLDEMKKHMVICNHARESQACKSCPHADAHQHDEYMSCSMWGSCTAPGWEIKVRCVRVKEESNDNLQV